jgi:hypothetical protein
LAENFGLWYTTASRVALPSFARSSKIGPDFSKKVVLELKLPKIILTENVLLNSYSSMKKKSERFE